MANLGYLQLTRNCLQHCRFCSNPPTGVELTIEAMNAAIEDIAALGYDGVILTGGEPTMSPLLLPALERAHAHGLATRMITNGQLLADPAFFRRCADAGLQHVHLSLHSYRPEVHDFISAYPRAWSTLVTALALAPEMGVTVDINCVICSYNADHLHENVMWAVDRFPFVRHYVWNMLDPDDNRTRHHLDIVPRHHEFQVSLELAMDFLDRTGRTFRAERVPLCHMRRFAWANTECRKIVLEEERCINFLDAKGFVQQVEWLHAKGAACDACRWDGICAGLHAMLRGYDERELAPVFEDPEPVVRAVIGGAPPRALMERLDARRGRRSPVHQPPEGDRLAALALPFDPPR
ncbi:MAG TPA: radical SAM protein [Myxococcota bacterium]|nr:radical SAM protein [Myxococcota bacterium]